MTVDDERSVYVGGISYDTSEDTLRRAFSRYGHIIAVKIVNDRAVGGKCYSFVTFKDSQSAGDAIDGMNGRTVDGRVIKVSEVRTRGGRPSFGRDSSRRNHERILDLDRDRDRDRERDYDYVSERSRDRNRERSRDRDQEKELGHAYPRNLDQTRERFTERDRDRNRDREMDEIRYDRERNLDHEREKDWDSDRDQSRELQRTSSHQLRDLDQTRELFPERDRARDRDREMEDIKNDNERSLDHEREKEWDSDRGQGRELQRTSSHHSNGNHDKDQRSRFMNGSSFTERHSKDHMSESSHGDHDQVEKRLDVSSRKLGELQQEITYLKEAVKQKEDDVYMLHEESQKLVHALAAAKKLTSDRKRQLAKLLECFLDMKDCNERLKTCEQDLQSFVDSTMKELQQAGEDMFGDLENDDA